MLFRFAKRHGYLVPGSNFLNPDDYDLGSGKRVLVKQYGRLDPAFQITGPEHLGPPRRFYYKYQSPEEFRRQLSRHIDSS